MGHNVRMFVKLALVILLVAFLVWWFQPDRPSNSNGSGVKLPPWKDRGTLSRPIGTIRTRDLPGNVLQEIRRITPFARNWGVLSPSQNIALPTSFDSRQKWPGLISDSLDQGSCGSCWAFSSATAISDRIRIKNPTDDNIGKMVVHTPFALGESATVLNSLNPYDLVDCDLCGANQSSHPLTTEFLANQNYCNQGCSGGVISYVYNYVKDQGVHTLGDDQPIQCNPQGEGDCPCDMQTPSLKKVYKISGVYSVINQDHTDQEKQQSIKMDIFMNGPVTIGYSVYQSFEDYFNANPKGIYTTAAQPANDDNIGGHAVDIIGWGTDPQFGDYWLVRNSWGVSWGDGGVFRIQYNWGDFMSQVYGAKV